MTTRKRRSTISDVDGKVEELNTAVTGLIETQGKVEKSLIEYQEKTTESKRREIRENRIIASLIGVVWVLLALIGNDLRGTVHTLTETVTSHLERIAKVESALEFVVPAVASESGKRRAERVGVEPPIKVELKPNACPDDGCTKAPEGSGE